MMSGMGMIGMIAVLIKLIFFVCVVVYAVKLLNRLTDISSAQKSIAASQAELVKLLASKEFSL